ncbi:helix-turn-helix domain-containing protein [Spirosoma aerolatum]|uniref:helix-turn-helix domain-containing protein n=1 Tax=Spirosoma aerolatum TaxID=1211326 RepID=UPI0009AE86A1|nr:helix-turn-helix domain-containing protein [Spirosoma aerolatum]
MNIVIDHEIVEGYKNALLKAVDAFQKAQEKITALTKELDESQLMTTKEAQDYLKCSYDSLLYYRRFGLTPYKKGKDVWYTKAIINEWLSTGRVNRCK